MSDSGETDEWVCPSDNHCQPCMVELMSIPHGVEGCAADVVFTRAQLLQITPVDAHQELS